MLRVSPGTALTQPRTRLPLGAEMFLCCPGLFHVLFYLPLFHIVSQKSSSIASKDSRRGKMLVYPIFFSKI